jgi:hypothetical protein
MRSRVEAAALFPWVGVMRVANAHGDGAGVNVTVINVPAILAIFGATAGLFWHGRFGHAGIEARSGELGKRACRLSLIV